MVTVVPAKLMISMSPTSPRQPTPLNSSPWPRRVPRFIVTLVFTSSKSQRASLATIPCDHLERVHTLATPTFENLTLLVLEAHDLALSKLERSQDRDLSDIQHLAAQGHINAKTLLERYHEEHRPYLLGDLHREDRTLNLWLHLCWPDDFPG